MARKNKRKRRRSTKKALKEKPDIFNPAFEKLVSKKNIKKPAIRTPEKREKPDESQVFLDAMSDVKPLSVQKSSVPKTPSRHIRPAHAVRDDDLETMAHLSDLVSGSAEMDISFSDEYVEGSVKGFSQKLMQRLKKGRFPIQDYVDLHGLTRQEAEIRVRDFIVHSHQFGLRCILVVHGRGLNSEHRIPVLKEQLPLWLSKGPVKKLVLAFSTARHYDGGTGAIYILLKRRRG